MERLPTVIFLTGSGGGTPDLSVFKTDPNDATSIELIGYPDWRRCIADDFSAEVLVAELVAEIERKVPRGPIYMIGLSLGGHLGYVAGLRLQAMGREVAGLCAIDSFMVVSSEPSSGWKSRALDEGLGLLRERRLGDFVEFLKSKFWRTLLRIAGSRLLNLLRRFSFDRVPLISDPILERELNMRLLVRETAPWLAKLDQEPAILDVPTVLLRTRQSAADDGAWQCRCPNIKIFEIAGKHHSFFEAENISSLRRVFLTATGEWRALQ